MPEEQSCGNCGNWGRQDTTGPHDRCLHPKSRRLWVRLSNDWKEGNVVLAAICRHYTKPEMSAGKEWAVDDMDKDVCRKMQCIKIVNCTVCERANILSFDAGRESEKDEAGKGEADPHADDPGLLAWAEHDKDINHHTHQHKIHFLEGYAAAYSEKDKAGKLAEPYDFSNHGYPTPPDVEADWRKWWDDEGCVGPAVGYGAQTRVGFIAGAGVYYAKGKEAMLEKTTEKFNSIMWLHPRRFSDFLRGLQQGQEGGV